MMMFHSLVDMGGVQLIRYLQYLSLPTGVTSGSGPRNKEGNAKTNLPLLGRKAENKAEIYTSSTSFLWGTLPARK
jgi:hypothetical protein